MRLEVVDDGLDPVAEAVATGATVRFGYRRADGDHMVRTVDAWGLVLRNGAAYLIGWDHDRGARRTFRLSRVTSRVTTTTVDDRVPVPPDFDAASVLDEVHGDGTDVEVFVRAAAVTELEQRGGHMLDQDAGDDGWRRGIVPGADATRLRSWLLAAADRVVVASPSWLRDEVTTALQALAGTTTGGGR